eukprot:scaffold9059_cov138-Amphora_coffeaeformis.AAC.2
MGEGFVDGSLVLENSIKRNDCGPFRVNYDWLIPCHFSSLRKSPDQPRPRTCKPVRGKVHSTNSPDSQCRSRSTGGGVAACRPWENHPMMYLNQSIDWMAKVARDAPVYGEFGQTAIRRHSSSRLVQEHPGRRLVQKRSDR